MPIVSLSIKNNINTLNLQALCRGFKFLLVVFFGCTNAMAETKLSTWKISGMNLNSDASGVQLSSNLISYDDIHLYDVSYHCPGSLSLYPHHACQDGNVVFTYDKNTYDLSLGTQFNAENMAWSADLSALSNQLQMSLKSADSAMNIEITNLQLAQFFTDAAHPLNTLMAEFNGNLMANLNDFSLFNSQAIEFQGVNFEYSDDIVVAELAGSLKFDLNISAHTLNLHLDITAGEMLFDQLYIDFSSYPIAMEHKIHINDAQKYEINSEILNLQSLLITSQVLMDDEFNWAVPTFKITVIDSHHFNQNILSNVLGIYGFGNSLMSGGFEILLNSNDSLFDRWQIVFDDFYLLNEKRKIQANALDGNIYWSSNELSADSQVHWQSLLLAGMPIDEAEMRFNFSKDQLNILGSHEFPIFDGAIILKELTIESMFSEELGMTLNASVLPISLKLITEKLNWPVMSGTISGDIPGMVKKGSVIDFLGALNLTVFNGNMLVENLSMERLFAVAPVIAADVSFDLFDLAMLTETFGFGQITGRLSGKVNDLRITNWKTDRMDAQVYTVKTKKVKQKISQKAIDNISSLGGIKGAISKTFLRFFDDFSYKKIKLSCKLHNSVCQIGGLKNQNNQFVIVEGGGIPKINIVGFVREINWEEFIARLLNANYSN